MTIMAKDPDYKPECVGDAHEWEIQPPEAGKDRVAIALCCGRKAVCRWGEWMLTDEEPERE